MIHLGIDFGTANTRASRLADGSIPRVLNIGRDSYSLEMMPSTCWIDSEHRVVVGERCLGRPDRIRFIKRYWQQRPEDEDLQPWKEGQRVIQGCTFKCADIVEAVLAEAVARALDCLSAAERQMGFTANLVCPVGFDHQKRMALVNILSRQGAHGITLGNVIDEPLAAAVLYCHIEEVPPVRRDLLLFDAGAGTVDVAIVRYEESDGCKRATVLAEAGRCTAGSDFDRVMENLVLNKLLTDRDETGPDPVYRSYGVDVHLGRLAFEDECERMKIALGRGEAVSMALRRHVPGLSVHSIQITPQEFCAAAVPVLFGITDAVKSALRMASTAIEDFKGVEMAILVGGTSRLSFVQDAVKSVIPGAQLLTHEFLDEMLATVRGAGLLKDFEDLVVLRPPYETKLRVNLQNGHTETISVNQAYEGFPTRQFFGSSVLRFNQNRFFNSPIDTIAVQFVKPSGANIQLSPEEFDPTCFQGCNRLEARLDSRALLTLESNGFSKSVYAPYFTQVGLKARRPFEMKHLSAPDFYPDDN